MTKKSLPIISSPSIFVTLPVSKKKIKFRPFIVKEQKALLMAQESMDVDSITDTVKSVISSCTFGEVDIDAIPSADLAYFFVQLRIQSVGPDVKFSVNCTSCDQEVMINFNMENLQVDTSGYSDIVMITDTIGAKFRIPSISDAKDFDPKSIQSTIDLLRRLLVNIFDENEVYDTSDYTAEEFTDWLDTFSDAQLEKIYNWTKSIPELRHELKFSCNHCKAENSRLLEGLHSFFRLGDDS